MNKNGEKFKKYRKKGDFITTNGMFPNIDNHRLTKECLDVYTYDSYPNFVFGLDRRPKEDCLNDRWNSKSQNEVRSVCPHYGIPGDLLAAVVLIAAVFGMMRLRRKFSVLH